MCFLVAFVICSCCCYGGAVSLCAYVLVFVLVIANRFYRFPPSIIHHISLAKKIHKKLNI